MAERYRLTHLVATGGMAEVYLGVARGAESFEKQVAIKRIHPHLAKDPQVTRMFLAEARVARHLHHQNIVEVLDVGKSADGLYLVMELVDGWSLGEILDRALVQRVRFPPPLAAFVAAQVMAGLTHAYRRTDQGKRLLIAHRDVSPSNILVSAEGEVKVADFGIAKLETISAATEPGTFKGKVDYASPEVLAGEPATAASDQFALGVVLYEMLAGRHPFGDSKHLMAYVQTLRSEPPPPLPASCGTLASITHRLLAKAASDRYPNEDEVSGALARYLAGCGVPTSSAELDRFVKTLKMALPFAQRPSPAEQARRPSFSLEETAPRATAPDPSEFQFATEFELDSQWAPAGPALDAEGHLVRPGPPTPEAGPRRGVAAPAPQLDAAGLSSLAEDPGGAEPDRAGAAGGELELAHPPRPMEAAEAPVFDLGPPKPRSRAALFVVLAALLLGTAVIAVFFLVPKSQRALSSLGLPTGPKPTLYLDSEPSGAKVIINGNHVGETPLFQDNLYPPGATVKFELRLKGYQTAQGHFQGGQPVKQQLDLERR